MYCAAISRTKYATAIAANVAASPTTHLVRLVGMKSIPPARAAEDGLLEKREEPERYEEYQEYLQPQDGDARNDEYRR
jgi:hypothetical protein